MKSIQLKNWNLNAEKQKKIDKKIATNSKLQNAVKHAQKKAATAKKTAKKNEKTADQASSLQGSDDEATALKKLKSVGGFPTHVFTVITRTDYYLRDSHLLDSAANAHICNKPQRFYDLRPATEDDFLYSGNTVIPIEEFETVDITVQTSDRSADISLYDTVLVSFFHISVVSVRKLKIKKIY